MSLPLTRTSCGASMWGDDIDGGVVDEIASGLFEDPIGMWLHCKKVLELNQHGRP